MKNVTRLYLATDHWQSAVFLISTTLEIWLWIQNQLANENYILMNSISGIYLVISHTESTQKKAEKSIFKIGKWMKTTKYRTTASTTSLPPHRAEDWPQRMSWGNTCKLPVLCDNLELSREQKEGKKRSVLLWVKRELDGVTTSQSIGISTQANKNTQKRGWKVG